MSYLQLKDSRNETGLDSLCKLYSKLFTLSILAAPPLSFSMSTCSLILIMLVASFLLSIEAPKTPTGDAEEPRGPPRLSGKVHAKQDPSSPVPLWNPAAEEQKCGHLIFSMLRWHLVSDNILAGEHPFRAHFACHSKCQESFRIFRGLAGRGFSGFAINQHASKFSVTGNLNFAKEFGWSDVCQASGRICYAWQTAFPYELDGRPAKRLSPQCMPRTTDYTCAPPVFAFRAVGCACEVKLQLWDVFEGEAVIIPGDPIRAAGQDRTHDCSTAAICKRLERRYPEWLCSMDRSEVIASNQTCPPFFPWPEASSIQESSRNADACPCNWGSQRKECPVRGELVRPVQESTPVPQLDPLVVRARGKRPMLDTGEPSSVPREPFQLPVSWSQAAPDTIHWPSDLTLAGMSTLWQSLHPVQQMPMPLADLTQTPLVDLTQTPLVDLTQTPLVDLTGPDSEDEGQLFPVRTSLLMHRPIDVEQVHDTGQSFQFASWHDAQTVASQSQSQPQAHAQSQSQSIEPNEWQFFDQSASLKNRLQRMKPIPAIDQDVEDPHASGARTAQRIGQGSQASRSSQGGVSQDAGQPGTHLHHSTPGQTEVAGLQPGTTGTQETSTGTEMPPLPLWWPPNQDSPDDGGLGSIFPFF